MRGKLGPVSGFEKWKILYLWDNGLSVPKIAKYLGRSQTTIRRILEFEDVYDQNPRHYEKEKWEFLEKNWGWVVPEKRKAKTKKTVRHLITPYWYPKMWSQLTEDQRPW